VTTRGRSVVALLAGPLLIVASVLVVLHDFAFGGFITFSQGDVAAYWLPTHCLMGRSLAAGHIPAWNPYSLAGAPFAADPQSGWMYLPVMALFSVFSCDVAIRLYIVVLPILAGLGMFWFLRAENVSRSGATMGGLVLSLAVAGSRLAINLPFSATLAWTSLLLASASRYLRSEGISARLAWGAVTALVWGQLAAAHLSHGFILGTGALVAYVAARAFSGARDGPGPREVLLLAVLLVPALFLVNLAYFLPRMAYLPRTTLGVGYAELQNLADALAGRPPRPFPIGPAAAPAWLMVFAISPGPYLGAAPLALSLAAWWNRPRRRLAIAFGVYGLVCYLLSLRIVARLLAPVIRAVPFGDFYLYSPFRFRYALLLVIPILAALGFEAWAQAKRVRPRLRMLLPAVVLWGLVPLLVVNAPRLWLLGVGAAAAGVALVAASVRPALFVLLPALLSVELVANGLIGQRSSHEFFVTGLGPGRSLRPLTPLLEPTIDAGSYLRPGPVVHALRAEEGGRYLSLNPTRGYLGYQAPEDWPFLTDQRSMLFGIEEAQGYNPVQPIRFWTFTRAMNPEPELHNVSILLDPSSVALDLLQVAWLIGPSGRPPEPGAVAVATEGPWTLYRRVDAPPRATVVSDWTTAPSAEASLRAIIRPGLDPAERAILEQDPFGAGATGDAPAGAGTAVYRWIGTQEARIDVEASGPAIVLIRTTYDPNWHATVDGRPVPIVRANYFLQAVPVPGGRHTIRLTYDDPWIGYGLFGSALSLALILAAAVLARRGRTGKRPPRGSAVPIARPSPPSPAG